MNCMTLDEVLARTVTKSYYYFFPVNKAAHVCFNPISTVALTASDKKHVRIITTRSRILSGDSLRDEEEREL